MKKLEIIFEAFLKDAVGNLAFPVGFINCSLFFREGSSGSESSYQQQSNSTDELDLKEEQECRMAESIVHEIEKNWIMAKMPWLPMIREVSLQMNYFFFYFYLFV